MLQTPVLLQRRQKSDFTSELTYRGASGCQLLYIIFGKKAQKYKCEHNMYTLLVVSNYHVPLIYEI